MMRREIEILCLLFFGYLSAMLGWRLADVGFRVFFFILAAMFLLAIFRPKESP